MKIVDVYVPGAIVLARYISRDVLIADLEAAYMADCFLFSLVHVGPAGDTPFDIPLRVIHGVGQERPYEEMRTGGNA
jgi:hypothetical protein